MDINNFDKFLKAVTENMLEKNNPINDSISQHRENSILNKVEVITEKYVMSLKENRTKVLILNKNQIITPLAKDKLFEYRIKIEYIEEAEL
ncbi:MAG: hypothetical protein KAH13_01600 [Tenericutes bacterium]|nr:hypothetical protein [Mycoplasmatota bacterium]